MKIVHGLGKQGYIETLRGKGGGLRLGRAPEAINLGAVVRDTEETLHVVECLADDYDGACRLTPSCRLKTVLQEAQDAFYRQLDGYTLRDLMENIIEPSKVISDQYGSEEIQLADGSTLVGRAYAENGKLVVTADPRNPEEFTAVALDQVKGRKPYPVSLMPAGMINPLNQDELLDLVAYLQSGGNPKHKAFAK